MTDERPGVGVVDLDRNVAKRLRGARQKPQRRLVAGIEALHVADLEHLAGAVACGDQLIDVSGGIGKRLLAEDMQVLRQSGKDMLLVQRVRRGDQHGVERLCEQAIETVECRDTVLRFDEAAHSCGRIEDAQNLKAALELEQVWNVLDLGNASRPDHADLYALHEASPTGAWRMSGLSFCLSVSRLWFHDENQFRTIFGNHDANKFPRRRHCARSRRARRTCRGSSTGSFAR